MNAAPKILLRIRKLFPDLFSSIALFLMSRLITFDFPVVSTYKEVECSWCGLKIHPQVSLN